MAHWAEIQDGIVTRVVVADSEEWLTNNLGGTWVQASYNTRGGQHILGGEPLRYNFPGIGWTYDETRDGFIPPKPAGLDSWILNDDTCLWEPPTPRPAEGDWEWDESAVAWVEVVEPSA